MDQTTFDLYILMVFLMAAAVYCIPKATTHIKPTTLVIGFLPTLALMAFGAQDQSMDGTALDPFAMGLIMMFFCPMLAVVIALLIARSKANQK